MPNGVSRNDEVARSLLYLSALGVTCSDTAELDTMMEPKPDLSSEWDKAKLRNWMTNAKRLGRDDIYQDAFRQLCRSEGRNVNDPLAAEFASVMRALEEFLTQEAGKTKRLNRTRQKLDRVGVRQTLADLAMKPQPSVGFLKLVEFGMADMSAESLILKYQTEFSPEVISAARKRLVDYGVFAVTENRAGG